MVLSIFLVSRLVIHTTGKPPSMAMAPQLMGLMGLPNSMLTTVRPTPQKKQAQHEGCEEGTSQCTPGDTHQLGDERWGIEGDE